jgi:hypothetical protein
MRWTGGRRGRGRFFGISRARGESGGARERGGEEDAAGSHALMLTGSRAQLKPQWQGSRNVKNL